MKNVDREIISIAQSRNVSKSNLANLLNLNQNSDDAQMNAFTQLESDLQFLKSDLQKKDAQFQKTQDNIHQMEQIISKLQDTVSFLVNQMQDFSSNMEAFREIALGPNALQEPQDQGFGEEEHGLPGTQDAREMPQTDKRDEKTPDSYNVYNKIETAIDSKMSRLEQAINRTLNQNISQLEEKLQRQLSENQETIRKTEQQIS